MTAAEKILQKRLVASGLDSSGWDRVQAGLKDRAFFSSRVESIRFLQGAQGRLAELLQNARNTDGAVTSRAQLVSDLMQSAREEGIATGKGGVADPGSAKRAAVIVDTNAGLARGYTSYVAGAGEGARLAYPANELVRVKESAQPRNWAQRWQDAGGALLDGGRMVALKDAPVWSKLSRFGTPWPPFDYGSGMGVAGVDFEECVALGLIQESWRPAASDPVQDFNAGLEADLSFKGADDPQWLFLKEAFGDQMKHAAGKVAWQSDVVGAAYRRAIADPAYQAGLRLGVPTPEALAAAPADARLSGRSLTMQADHLRHELQRHIGAAETHAANVPLADADLSLIPHVWRRPDRVVRDPKSGALYFELKGADGNWYRLVVDSFAKESRFRTFYKVKAGASGLPAKG
jgi:hypothetical protein